jgi:hypothetical protein
MEDELTFSQKWKTTSIFRQMEDNLNILANGGNLNILANERPSKCFGKWKTTSLIWQKEDLNILANGRRPQYFLQKEDDFSIKSNGRQHKYLEDKRGLKYLANGRQPQILIQGQGIQPQFHSWFSWLRLFNSESPVTPPSHPPKNKYKYK